MRLSAFIVLDLMFFLFTIISHAQSIATVMEQGDSSVNGYVCTLLRSLREKYGREPGRIHPGALICEFEWRRDRRERENELSESGNG